MKLKPIAQKAFRLMARLVGLIWRLLMLLRFRLFGLIKSTREWVLREKGKTSPLGIILQDMDANKKLHDYLLSTPDKNTPARIEAGGRIFEVGTVSINPAPEVNTPSRIITG